MRSVYKYPMKPVYQRGYNFKREGVDLYDGGKHIGCVLPRTRSLALYSEGKRYMSTVYRHRLIEWIGRDLGWLPEHITWF